MLISVRGISGVETPPELGVLSLDVSVEQRDRRAAFDGAHAASAGVVRIVERETAEAGEGNVSRLAVSPISVNSWRPHSETGELMPEVHTATARISVAFREVERLSRVAAELGRADHVRLAGISWELTEETARTVRDDQTAAAVVEALRRAEVMARAAGAGPAAVVEIADPGLLAQPQAEATAMFARAAAFGGEEADSLDPEFLQIVARPVRTEVTVHARCEA